MSDALSDDAVSDALSVDAVSEDVLRCASCGRALDGDPDEDPVGDEGLPICGECARETDFFVMDLADGALDGAIE